MPPLKALTKMRLPRLPRLQRLQRLQRLPLWAPRLRQYSELYLTHHYSPGTPFFLPKGTRVFQKLSAFVRAQMQNYGYTEVVTPQLYRKELWKISGHWDHYKDDMFGVCDGHGHNVDTAESAELEYSLKPMNCPGHCLVFKSQERSFRDLPVKLSDLSPLHRNEASGALSGLTRVRRFHQDDGHIFCTPDQVAPEILSSIKLIDTIYSLFGLTFSMTLSTRPLEFIGEKALWEKAEADLSSVLKQYGTYKINEGDGAFYGPKIDFMVVDKHGKSHQTATIQLDFNLPIKFGLEYDGPDQKKHIPVMVHRAVFGSFERFLAMLIDHFEGAWPFWLSPYQAIVLPVSDAHAEYARKIQQDLRGIGKEGIAPLYPRNYDVDLFAQAEPLGGRLRRAAQLHPNYVIVVGDKELSNGTLSVKKRGDKKSRELTLEDLKAEFEANEAAYL